MDSDDKFWLGVWALIAMVLCVLIISSSINMYATNVKAFEYGYERVIQRGSSCAHWMKAD
jgi:hypothetical protein